MADNKYSEREANSKKNQNSKKKESPLKTIIITALVTALISFLPTYYFQNSKLKEEQKYWEKRFKVEQIQKIIDKKIDILNQLNSDILQSEILMKEIRIEAVDFDSYIKGAKPDFKFSDYKNKIFSYHTHNNFLAVNMQKIPVFFPDSVQKLTEELRIELENNYNLSAIMDSLYLRKSISISDINFESIENLSLKRQQLIRIMLNDIGAYHNILYNDFLDSSSK